MNRIHPYSAGSDVVRFWCALITAIGMTGTAPILWAHPGHSHDPLHTHTVAENSNTTSAALQTSASQPLSHVVTVQPIIVSNDDGTNTAGFFGNASQQAQIETLIDQIWSQAGIDIAWLTPNTWNNSLANIGTPGANAPRSTSDLFTTVRNGDTAVPRVGSAIETVIDLYFVEIVPGFSRTSTNTANGLARVNANGIAIHIGDNLPTFSNGRDVAASVTAHEIGHNLGLSHISEPFNLLQPGGSSNQGERLNQQQANQTQASRFSIRIGDLNQDGVTDANDLPEFVLALEHPETFFNKRNVYAPSVGDLNRDGVFDLQDARLAANTLSLVNQTAVNRTQNYIDLDQAFDILDDGLLNNSSVNFFATELATPVPYEFGDSRGDITGPDGVPDGRVDALDIDLAFLIQNSDSPSELQAVLATLGEQVADADGDGELTQFDALAFANLATAAQPEQAFDAQAFIASIDLQRHLQNTPEPRVLSVGLLLLMLLNQRRARAAPATS